MALIVTSYLPGEKPFESERHWTFPVECDQALSYWAGLSEAWKTDETLINVEHDMEFSDDLVDGLLACPHPACAYPYTVFPTKLGHFIYCGTHDRITDEEGAAGRKPGWIQKGEEWADWHSIGFVKIAPEARVKPLDRMIWQYLEHSVDRVVCVTAGLRWHLHWPEVQHYHDYNRIPDHLW